MSVNMNFVSPQVSRRDFFKIGAAAAAVAALGITTGCSGAGTSGSGAATSVKIKEGGTVVYAIEEPITSLNWYNNSDTDLGKQVFSNIWSPLCKFNSDGTPDYKLAKEIKISDDGTTYTVVLRDDIKWSDGEKITADDVVFTMDLLANEQLKPNTSSAYKVDKVFCEYKKVSDTEVEFKVGRASNLFRKAVGSLVVLPAHAFSGVDQADTYTSPVNDKIAISGAYKVDTFSTGEKIVCVKNENYFGDKGHIDGFEVNVVSDSSTQEIAFRNGEYSLFTISNSETLANYNGSEKYNVVSYPDGRITFMEINPNAANTDSMDKRKAVIDALKIDDLVYGTYGDAIFSSSAKSIRSKGSMFYNDSVQNYTQNLDEAKKLMKENNLEGAKINIIFNSARVGQEELCIMIKNQLDAVGFDAQINSMETAAYFKSYFYATDTFNIAIMANDMDSDPSSSVGLFNNTKSGKNMYTTEKLNGMWDELDKEMDQSKRQKIMDEAIEELHNCWSCVPVCDTNYVCATQKNLGGLEDSSRLSDLTKVYFTE